MQTASPSLARDVVEPPEALPSELERRIALIEAHSSDADFDAASWAWMLLLGVMLPAVLLVLGWVL